MCVCVCFFSNAVSSVLHAGSLAESLTDLKESGLVVGLHFNITEGAPIAAPSAVLSLLNRDTMQFRGKVNTSFLTFCVSCFLCLFGLFFLKKYIYKMFPVAFVELFRVYRRTRCNK